MLHRRLARRVERVVRDVVDGADDPTVVAEIEDVDARGRLLEGAEVGAVAGERVGDDDAIDAAVEDGERDVPVRVGKESVDGGKDPVEELKPVAAHVTGFCAKDCAEPKGDVMIQFGTGKVDFKGVFQVLKGAGFQGPIMVEGCAPGDTPGAVSSNARANREFLERILADLGAEG